MPKTGIAAPSSATAHGLERAGTGDVPARRAGCSRATAGRGGADGGGSGGARPSDRGEVQPHGEDGPFAGQASGRPRRLLPRGLGCSPTRQRCHVQSAGEFPRAAPGTDVREGSGHLRAHRRRPRDWPAPPFAGGPGRRGPRERRKAYGRCGGANQSGRRSQNRPRACCPRAGGCRLQRKRSGPEQQRPEHSPGADDAPKPAIPPARESGGAAASRGARGAASSGSPPRPEKYGHDGRRRTRAWGCLPWARCARGVPSVRPDARAAHGPRPAGLRGQAEGRPLRRPVLRNSGSGCDQGGFGGRHQLRDSGGGECRRRGGLQRISGAADGEQFLRLTSHGRWSTGALCRREWGRGGGAGAKRGSRQSSSSSGRGPSTAAGLYRDGSRRQAGRAPLRAAATLGVGLGRRGPRRHVRAIVRRTRTR